MRFNLVLSYLLYKVTLEDFNQTKGNVGRKYHGKKNSQ